MIRNNKSDQVAAATSSLNLLLREDRLLQEHGLTESKSDPDRVAFPYAAALLQDESTESTKHKADVALQDVERKLALVESLAVKLSRTSPEAVAGHLLRLHGYQIHKEGEETTSEAANVTTLATVRDRADRLQRQGEVLENVARRVESSLTKGLKRMETATTKLERVLTLSSSLKMILRLQFENNKLQNYDLEDLRDLTRAAASVAVVEDLLKAPEMNEVPRIGVVEVMRPQIQQIAAGVRQAAAKLLKEQYQKLTAVQQLGATLQVYYHLGELPDAVWQAVESAHGKAEAVSRNLFNGMTLSSLTEQAKKIAKDNRDIRKKLALGRTEAVEEWAAGVFEAATQVRNLNFVLTRKSDPITRQLFVDVVAQAPLPLGFQKVGSEFFLFDIFWNRFCSTLFSIIENLLGQDQYREDVAALYPVIRSLSKDLIGSLQESVPASSYEDTSTTPVAGILGGTIGLDDEFLGWSSGQEENPQTAGASDSWTKSSSKNSSAAQSKFTSHGSVAFHGLTQSKEWIALYGSPKQRTGLFSLERAFLEGCTERLCAPLQYLFPDNVVLDDDGVAMPTGTSLLPSKYDIQRFDENIRQELALADPREGGGDLNVITMIAECVVNMMAQFCARAKNAIGGSRQGYITSSFSMSESLQHDRKVTVILYTMAKNIREAAEKTFVAPYQPAVSQHLLEAAAMCQEALKPAALRIDKLVHSAILSPLCQAVDEQIGMVLSKMHQGVFRSGSGGMDGDGPAFVQDQISPVFDAITKQIFSKFPPEYASDAASTIAEYTVFAYISNATMVRPLDESVRLHITQDLADLELVLEQLMSKLGNGKPLSKVGEGKPYAELRAVRQMLFWAGLESKNRTGQEIARSLLRESWCKDVRPSTLMHYLFSYGPNLLSSPHHLREMKMEDFINTLVFLDGSVSSGEDEAWMIVMKCCDLYQQRASSASSESGGDVRIPQVLMALGPELMRRHRL